MRARDPAFADPPNRTDPGGAVRVWYTDPPGCVMQFTRPTKGAVKHAEWLVGPEITDVESALLGMRVAK